VKKLDIRQMYNNSAMLHDAFRSKANEVGDSSEKQFYDQLANDQKAISDRLKPKTGDNSDTTMSQQSGNVSPNQINQSNQNNQNNQNNTQS
jgi:hypothetical protein